MPVNGSSSSCKQKHKLSRSDQPSAFTQTQSRRQHVTEHIPSASAPAQGRQEEGQGGEEGSGQPGEGLLGRPPACGERP